MPEIEGAVHVVVPPLLDDDVDPPELLVEPLLEDVDPLLELVDPLLLLLLDDVDSSPFVSLPGFVFELSLAGFVLVDSTEQATSEDTTATAANAAKE